MNDNYIPFGEEWRTHVLKLSKTVIVDELLTPALTRLDELKKYDLSKLEAATEKLRNAWPENWPLAVDEFLRAITRETTNDNANS